ncbi:ParB/RepB/Spo0J family partition protein [Dysosmobacter sp.]|jgi:ParB family chromosome partitioning protein|uniref:ParB/RepB/Spo0J family partition protein n=1 Tax=Dysosmobacter sp. TaxID=2591382 RepID=UPI00174A361B
MAKSNGLNFNLPSVDDLFSTEEERAEARLEKVVNLSPSEISDFPNHPFKVRMDAAMQEMTESVKQYGVLVPALVRPKPEGGYEMVAGHRRKTAADLAGLAEIPCIVRQLTDDEATIIMVDSNLQREQILPSEKAFAYKMKLDAMKRQAGRPRKDNSAPVGPNLIGTRSNLELAAESPDSKTQIQRYIRLTHLIPEILELVDNSVLKDPDMLQIALRPAVELSYLRKEEQADLFAIMDEMDCTPSHAQAIKMRRMSEAKTGDERLSMDAMAVIMEEEKGNQKEQFKIPKEKISRFFAPGTPTQKIEDTIVKALELYRKRQRSLER